VTIDWRAGEGTLTAGGKHLEWAAYGPGPDDAPVIVMLHEGLGCVALWRDFPAKVSTATGLPVLAYSRAGYGQSDTIRLPRPLDYMTREAVDVLPDILDAIGARQFILLGHSDGATIAAEHAGRTGDARVAALILMAPHFFTEPMGLAEIALAGDAFRTGGLKERMAKYHRDPDAAFRGWNDAWLDPGFKAWNVAGVLDGLRIPVLAIQGADDQYGTPAQLEAIRTRSSGPVEVALLGDCRHSPHLDKPQETLQAIAAFTSRLFPIDIAEIENA
jgi:pimeloyl-ACP methyl ester carboxylesterase